MILITIVLFDNYVSFVSTALKISIKGNVRLERNPRAAKQSRWVEHQLIYLAAAV